MSKRLRVLLLFRIIFGKGSCKRQWGGGSWNSHLRNDIRFQEEIRFKVKVWKEFAYIQSENYIIFREK